MKGKKIELVFRSVGGFEQAWTTTDLPSTLNQVYDLTCKDKNKHKIGEAIELAVMCNQQEGKPNAFVRELLYSSNLIIILCSYLVHFPASALKIFL